MRRGGYRKRWGEPGHPWYAVCYCLGAVAARIGPADVNMKVLMEKAAAQGWVYTPRWGLRCPACAKAKLADRKDKRPAAAINVKGGG